jgi:AhpD family alkylhydroperoxidase
MNRFPPLFPDATQPHAQALLDRTQASLGRVPLLYRAMAHAPVALEGYLVFRQALQQGQLSPEMRERLALLAAEENRCEYCSSAHSFRSAKLGLPSDEVVAARSGGSALANVDAAMRLAREVLRGRGHVSPGTFDAALAAGWSLPQLGELVAHLALNIFSNYFAVLAQPELDFPHVALLKGGE